MHTLSIHATTSGNSECSLHLKTTGQGTEIEEEVNRGFVTWSGSEDFSAGTAWRQFRNDDDDEVFTTINCGKLSLCNERQWD